MYDPDDYSNDNEFDDTEKELEEWRESPTYSYFYLPDDEIVIDDEED